MDISAFTKVEVSGPDAASLLDRLLPNRLPQKVGGIGLSHFLHESGRIELETTVVKLAEDRFYLVCAAFFETRLTDYLSQRIEGADVSIRVLSTDWAALALQGPKSRDVLAATTPAALDNASFRWLSAQEISIAGHSVWAMRLSYAGELGWEIHGPAEAMLVVYDALWAAGEAHGITDYGSFAMNAMRMEKMFKGAGELTNEVTLPEADVMRFVRLDKDFVGKAATEASAQAQQAGDMPWTCAYLVIEPEGDEDGHGGEAVLLNGEVVGSTSSVAFGPTVGKILAFAYIRPAAATPGQALEVVIQGKPRKAVVADRPLYDPDSLLPRTDAV
ncbi:MAG: Dimethylglycine oxidase [Rhodospirillaceae bacterium]|nr:MAG: Dimethylglycine oxidase [Rhodospirillaceae bacterium]